MPSRAHVIPISSRVFWTHIGFLFALVGSACWFATDFSWEPGLALGAAVVSFCLASSALLRHQFKRGEQSCLARLDPKISAEIVASALDSLVAARSAKSDIERSMSSAYGLLFYRLKILDKTAKAEFEPLSERAALFIRSLARTVRDGVSFCGDWRALGTGNESADKLGYILRLLEEHRIAASGGLSVVAPLRKVQSSLVLIKAKSENGDLYLLRWSESWGGYYWFVGGLQSGSDANPDECARRELKEKLGLGRAAIQALTRLTSVDARRVSERLHFLTDYHHTLYCVALNDDSPEAKRMLKKAFTVNQSVGSGHQVQIKCKWSSWEAITAMEDLRKNAGEVLRAIEAFGLEKIQFSYRDGVREDA